MSFRVAARTILHLGSELISSDGVAFYELIKNSLDANSPEVRIDVVQRIGFNSYDTMLRWLGERRSSAGQSSYSSSEKAPGSWKEIQKIALDAIDTEAPHTEELIQQISQAKTKKEFTRLIREANYIEVDDDGEGMSIKTLRDVYLTIGTSNRSHQRNKELMKTQASDGQSGGRNSVILGEKGLGRLSAMRIGDAMEVISGIEGGKNWNVLDIDWNDFANSADEDIGSIVVEPKIGERKDEVQTGTLIRILALTSDWSYEKLEELARENFSKLVDPFSKKKLPLRVILTTQK